MELLIRPIAEEEFPLWGRSVSRAFGDPRPSEGDMEDWSAITEFDRTVAVFDGDDIVGNAGAFTVEVTLPGLEQARAAAVTAVGVAATHRRRGVLTNMMRHQLDDVRERGEAIAMLWASESIIYGRFGYGLGSLQNALEIETRYAAFRGPLADTGRVRLIEPDEAAKVIPDVHERARRLRPGDMDRPQVWWDHWFKDKEKERHGAGARFYLVHETEPGSADGFAAYNVKGNWEGGLPGASLQVHELSTLSDTAYAALWRTMLDTDLVKTVAVWQRPLDEPLRHLLADARRLQTKAVNDNMWVRLVDVPAALAARRYASPGRLVLEVQDPFCPWNDGRYALEGGPDGASCNATSDAPDLVLSSTELSALYLGGNRASTLARAGRIDEERAGALDTADLMFLGSIAPFCSRDF